MRHTRRFISLAATLVAIFLTLSAWANPFEHQLTNGLRVIVKEDRRAPTAVHMVWYRAGSMDETNGTTGVAHLLEHMMFTGTPTIGAGEFSRLVAAAGGRDNAFTSRDYTAYFQQVPKQKLEQMMQLEADRMRHLTLDPKEFGQEIKVVMEERRLRTDDQPQAMLFEHHRLRLIVGAQAALFHDHFDFLRKFFGVEIQMPHPIRFELHHLLQLLPGHLLEIGGVILAGKSIVTPAHGSHQTTEFAGPNTRRALEHHVLQQVRHARGAVGFIHAAGAIPDHMCRRRGAMVFLDDDAQAIGQLMLKRIGQRHGRRRQKQQEGDQFQVAHGHRWLLLKFGDTACQRWHLTIATIRE